MKILLIGSGGREHALAWRLAGSPSCTQLYCAPGNPGIAEFADLIPIAADDIDGLVIFAKDNKVDLVVPGPETPLVKGLADRLVAAGIKCFGPSKDAARLEGSKGFTKDLCAKYDIPTAAYGRFTDIRSASAFIETSQMPLVIKADGLAAGKGVVICQTHEEAQREAQDMLSGESFGTAGASIVIEEFLDGEEVSYFAITDGKTVMPLTSAQDHKRVHDGDRGPNTGGMGAYSPAHLMTPQLEARVLERIIWPTVDAMRAEGCPFQGVLFAGLMIVDGMPYLIEYNVRFGDPECQAMMMRFQGDFAALLAAASSWGLAEAEGEIRWTGETALCVVMAANGYPGEYVRGTVIEGIAKAEAGRDVRVFHAGTAVDAKDQLVASGGRVLGVTALGQDVTEAQRRAYEAVDHIKWPGGFCRRDIGWRAVAAQREARRHRALT